MAEPVSISSNIAERYAQAIFDLELSDGKVDALSEQLAGLKDALSASGEFVEMIASPIYARADQANAIAALAKKMGLSPILSNALSLMAQKRRLFVLPQLLTKLSEKIAAHKGEVTAEVVSARALSNEQAEAVRAALKSKMGKDIHLELSVDDSLIGGMIVKIGSKMVDSSIRSKLNALENVMKEVG